MNLMPRWSLILATLAFAACGGGGSDSNECTNLRYLDQDGDGFGDPEAELVTCQDTVPGYVSNAGDCNDTAVLVNPDGVEVCDTIDNNCDGEADEGFELTTWYPDNDEDGFGDDANALTTCSSPAGLINQGGDCDDTDPLINPNRNEVCDGVDNNCDTLVDDDDPNLQQGSTAPFWPDTDGDGFGDATVPPVQACTLPPGHAATATDCDDTNGAINTNALEVCDPSDVDENCNGLADSQDPTVDPTSLNTFFADGDGDGEAIIMLSAALCCATASCHGARWVCCWWGGLWAASRLGIGT